MGIYDRDYYRNERRSFLDSGVLADSRWLVIGVTAFVFLFDIASERMGGIAQHLVLFPTEAWEAWRLVTHVLIEGGGPFILLLHLYYFWIFAGLAQQIRPGREILALYVIAALMSGLTFTALSAMTGNDNALYGLTPSLWAIVAIGTFYFPTAPLTVFGLFDLETRWFALILFVLDGHTIFQQPGVEPAHLAILAGPAFALLYGTRRWNLTGWMQGSWKWGWTRRQSVPEGRATLKMPTVHTRPADPEQSSTATDDDDENDRVDEILEKIHRMGQAALTEEEKSVLTRASERSRRRRERS